MPPVTFNESDSPFNCNMIKIITGHASQMVLTDLSQLANYCNLRIPELEKNSTWAELNCMWHLAQLTPDSLMGGVEYCRLQLSEPGLCHIVQPYIRRKCQLRVNSVCNLSKQNHSSALQRGIQQMACKIKDHDRKFVTTTSTLYFTEKIYSTIITRN